MEQWRTHCLQFIKTLRLWFICPSWWHIQCFPRHSLSLALDYHKLILGSKTQLQWLFWGWVFLKLFKISSNPILFPQTEALANMPTHIHCFDSWPQSRPVLNMERLFSNTILLDPPTHYDVRMEHTIVCNHVLQLYFPQIHGISSNSWIFLKFDAFRVISRLLCCLRCPGAIVTYRWVGGGCADVLFVFRFCQMLTF